MNKRTLRIILGDRPIAYHPYLAKVMGNVAGGVWLSQILYWDSVKASMSEDESENWFFKTDAEIIGETCLSQREVREAKSRAREIGIVKTERRGMPAKTHYLVDLDALETAITSLYNGVKQDCTASYQQDGTKPLVKLTPDYAESTPKSTIIAPSAKTPKSNSPIKQDIPKAVEVFREVRRSYPLKELYPLLDSTVGSEPAALDLWRKVLIGWAAMGWNPRNVDGALEFFKRGDIPHSNGKAIPKNNSTGATENKLDLIAECLSKPLVGGLFGKPKND